MHGCCGTWSCSPGKGQAILGLSSICLLLHQFLLGLDWLFRVVDLQSMRLVCSLERFTSGYNCCEFFDQIWRQHRVSVTIFELLSPAEQHLISRAHIIVACERQELALAATAERLGLATQLSSYSVPTPPVAAW